MDENALLVLYCQARDKGLTNEEAIAALSSQMAAKALQTYLDETNTDLSQVIERVSSEASGAVIRLSNYRMGSKLNYTVSEDVTTITALGKNIVSPTGFTMPENFSVSFADGVHTITNNNAYSASAYQSIYLAAGVYTLSADANQVGVAIHTSANGYLYGFVAGTNQKTTFTIAESGTYRIYISLYANTTETITNLMLEVGAVKTDYEAYVTPIDYVPGDTIPPATTIMVNGTSIDATYETKSARLNRGLQSLLYAANGARNNVGKIVRLYDYIPQSLVEYEVNEDATKIVALGKNLVDQNSITVANESVVVTKSDGRIDIANNNGYVSNAKVTLNLKPGAYTLSALDNNVIQTSVYRNGVYVAGFVAGQNKSATFTVADEDYPYVLKMDVSANGSGYVTELMLEPGTLKTDYEMYTAPIEYAVGAIITAIDTLYTDGTEIDVTYRTNQLKFADNPLYGKKALYGGDSICAASTAGVIGYPSLIAQANGMDMVNYGVDGGTVAYYAGKHCISRDVANMSADADYIIFEGGINDYWLNVALGEVSTGYAAALDDTTFCGAFEQMLKNAILKWPGKKIGYILIHKVFNTTPSAYWDKAREICEKWSVPCLDLYKGSGLCYELADIRTEYSKNADGCHPNYDGYMVLVPKIEAWMRTL